MKNLKTSKKITICHIFKYPNSIFGEKRKCLRKKGKEKKRRKGFKSRRKRR
ncbi:MAG: hypothetical protein GQ469_01515 [Methanosarcinales archaeon]|nr:hypothetical protein [Methanosarcinales archaeon]